jgi:ribosomal protein S18 acetylase RimI-like enzyme
MNSRNQTGITVRIAEQDDAVGIATAERETAGTPGLLVGIPGEIPLGAYKEKIASLSERGRYIVAEETGVLVGHAFLDPMEMLANAHVFRLTVVVRPGCRGRGIGRALLQDLLAWASSDPRVRKVELLVRATNARAIRLYRDMGFVEEGRFRRRVRLADGSYIDDIAMAWFPFREGFPDTKQ